MRNRTQFYTYIEKAIAANCVWFWNIYENNAAIRKKPWKIFC